MNTRKIDFQWLGRMAYEPALALQEKIQAQLIRGEGRDTVLTVEHDPVYTMGRHPDQSSLGAPTHLPHPVHYIGRGGQATYHGPGQLVAYPIIDLSHRGKDLHAYLRQLEAAIIATCAHFGVNAQRREGLTGCWVKDRKIASIGVGAKRWVTLHGLALNVCCDLNPFYAITPCGIDQVQMTSLALETDREISLDEVTLAIKAHLLEL